VYYSTNYSLCCGWELGGHGSRLVAGGATSSLQPVRAITEEYFWIRARVGLLVDLSCFRELEAGMSIDFENHTGWLTSAYHDRDQSICRKILNRFIGFPSYDEPYGSSAGETWMG